MATQIEDLKFTKPASGDLSGDQYRAVVVNASGQVATAGAGVDIDGVLQNKPDAAGKAATVGYGGAQKVRAGAATTAGGPAVIDVNGDFIDAVGASGDIIVGKFFEAAGGAGEIIECLLRPGGRAA